MTPQLHTELWTSWASLLRSYAAAHGLNSTQHAVVEVSANEITLRVGSRWTRFTATEMQQENGTTATFTLTEDGNVQIDGSAAEEMDMAAERVARECLSDEAAFTRSTDSPSETVLAKSHDAQR